MNFGEGVLLGALICSGIFGVFLILHEYFDCSKKLDIFQKKLEEFEHQLNHFSFSDQKEAK